MHIYSIPYPGRAPVESEEKKEEKRREKGRRGGGGEMFTDTEHLRKRRHA